MSSDGVEEVTKWMIGLYLDGGYSTRRIAEVVGIDRQRVARIFKDQGVVLAPRGAGRSRPLRIEGVIGEDTLRHLYINRRMSSVEIGRALGISDRFVRGRLKLWAIETRSRGQFDRFDRSDVDPDELRPFYVEKEWATSVVGEELGVSGKLFFAAPTATESPFELADRVVPRRHTISV